MKLTPKQLPHPWTPTNPDGMAWYIPAWNPGYYLHKDCVIRQGVIYHGQQMGYYATEAEALDMVAKFQAENSEAAR